MWTGNNNSLAGIRTKAVYPLNPTQNSFWPQGSREALQDLLLDGRVHNISFVHNRMKGSQNLQLSAGRRGLRQSALTD